MKFTSVRNFQIFMKVDKGKMVAAQEVTVTLVAMEATEEDTATRTSVVEIDRVAIPQAVELGKIGIKMPLSSSVILTIPSTKEASQKCLSLRA